ncbi:MAG: acyltransferase [Saprospiraceae bacterium]|nr:acyltransferase [Saprospiraceae bacterium]
MSRFSSFILRLWGWKFDSPDVRHIPKLLVVVIPHTSNWDFPLGILIRSAIKMDVMYLAKNELFRPPLGWIFRALHGYPVDRSGGVNFVDAVIRLFNSKERFKVQIAPEGTRKKVKRLKSGFYYIAKGANIPIMLCKFDWENKYVGFGEPFDVGDSYEEVLEIMEDYFKGVKGAIPEFGWQKNEPQSA